MYAYILDAVEGKRDCITQSTAKMTKRGTKAPVESLLSNDILTHEPKYSKDERLNLETIDFKICLDDERQPVTAPFTHDISPIFERRFQISFDARRNVNMVASSIVCGSTTNAQTLFDFTRTGSDNALLASWIENSDTAKNTGMSKAAFVIQKSQVFQRAVLFTLLNPKKNGAEYAAVQCDTSFNIGDFNNICLRCRAQGINVNYKMLLRHKGLDKNSLIYGQVFTAPTSELATIKLPLGAFKPYYRGQELSLESNPLDATAITCIGLKIDKGAYLPDNQNGVAALEIDWIKATK